MRGPSPGGDEKLVCDVDDLIVDLSQVKEHGRRFMAENSRAAR
jgi:hypothetical protein